MYFQVFVFIFSSQITDCRCMTVFILHEANVLYLISSHETANNGVVQRAAVSQTNVHSPCKVMSYKLLFFIFLHIFFLSHVNGYEVDCTDLKMGQYICPDPAYDQIDPKTQQFYGCTKENKAKGMPVALWIE